MGTMSYMGMVVEFDDRVLTHLQIVIMQKFRRGEAFPMSWVDAVSIGSGRSAMWLTPSTPIFFKFDGSRVPAIDPDWVDRLTRSAESPRGLIVTDASGELIHATGANHRPVALHSARN